jgi:fibronectin type 3 domain-containing protein
MHHFRARETLLSVSLGFLLALMAACTGVSGGGGGSNGGGGGTTVPAAPTGLQATGDNAQVALTWSASTGATSYHVKRATTNGGPYTQIASPATASYTDTSVTNGTTYYYVVSALNTAGESANSSQASATPTAPIQAPAAPTGLQATGGNAQVALTWSASTGATNYHVKRAMTNGGPYTQIAAPTTTSYTDTSVTNGTTYYYVVSALNTAGESANSSQASATPTAPTQAPAAPTGLQATGGNAQVALTWSASTGATSYHVKRATTNGGPYTQIASPTGASYTDTSVTNGTTYYYVVSALNTAGESVNSSQASATPTGGSGTAVTVNVDPLSNRHAINPNVYGGAYPKDKPTIADTGMTVVRWGGDATSRYNWQTFTYNAANDYYYSDYLNGEIGDADSRQFVSDVISTGSQPLMTMVMLPWVSKGSAGNNTDNGQLYSFSVAKYGAQCAVNPNTGNGDAGDGLKTDCSTPITGNDPNDANVPIKDSPSGGDPAGTVYRNGWAAALATSFGSSPHFYDMDNEIDIWASTHRDVHPNATTYEELRDTYLAEARALKTWDPAAIRFGPVSCCWYFYWNSWAGTSDKQNHGGVEFLPWWLNEVLWSDEVAATRSIEVFDLHAYPGVPSTSGLTTAQEQAATLRVYRDWWDPTYVSEGDDINQNFASDMQPLKTIAFRIPRMRALLNAVYPGTLFSFTEWSAALAGESDFSTALADAEAYGILGREHADLASRWTAPDPANPNYQALKLYRNYDGGHHTFGSTSISATHNAGPNLFGVYAALNATGNAMTMIVVNKDPANAAQVTFQLNSFTPGAFTPYTLSQTSPTAIVAGSSHGWNATQTFAPYTATLLVISGALAKTPAAEWELNPDSIQVAAGGTVTLAPMITSGSGSVTLSSAQVDTNYTANGTQSGAGGSAITITSPSITITQPGAISITAASTPGFYHFTVTGQDGSGANETQGGWIVVGNPAATLAKTGDNQSGMHGSNLNLSVTLNPGSSGGTNTGASVLFTTDSGNFAGATQQIVTTNSSGVAAVTLTLPATAGSVTVTAEGPFGLGHPVATFTETAQ